MRCRRSGQPKGLIPADIGRPHDAPQHAHALDQIGIEPNQATANEAIEAIALWLSEKLHHHQQPAGPIDCNVGVDILRYEVCV
jgi:hypothetical protein